MSRSLAGVNYSPAERKEVMLVFQGLRARKTLPLHSREKQDSFCLETRQELYIFLNILYMFYIYILPRSYTFKSLLKKIYIFVGNNIFMRVEKMVRKLVGQFYLRGEFTKNELSHSLFACAFCYSLRFTRFKCTGTLKPPGWGWRWRNGPSWLLAVIFFY